MRPGEGSFCTSASPRRHPRPDVRPPAKHHKKGKCHERVEVAVAWDADHKPVQYEAGQCTCQQYIGPQPLSQIYAEDLTDLA